jgi:hypothetical protein
VSLKPDGSIEGWCAHCQKTVLLGAAAPSADAVDPLPSEQSPDPVDETVAPAPPPERRVEKLPLLSHGLPWNDDGVARAEAIVQEYVLERADEGWELLDEAEFQVSASAAGEVISMATLLLQRTPTE